jgi:aryl-alcohol dehydrogenase-like predicted oxidoreductase
VEWLAIVQLHTVDPDVPLEESLGALADLRAEGKIAHVGLSNVTPDEVIRASRSMPIASVQNCYNLADRHAEPVLSLCEALGAAFLPWFPLARGLATQHSTVRSVATRHGVTPAQVALAWLLKRSTRLVAIPGSASAEHVAENASAAWVALDAASVRELDEVAGSQPPLIVDDSSLRTRGRL